MTPTVTKTNTTALASHLRLVVARLARRLRKEVPSGISPSLLSALATVDRRGPLTLGELATAEQIAPPSMTRIVATLTESGLVERVPDPIDRRVAWIGISADGRVLLQRSRRQRDAYLVGHLKSATPEELAVLERAVEILERLTEGQA